MVGLTTFRLMSDTERSSNHWFHADDETCFEFLNAHVYEEFTGVLPTRLGFAATSSTFPLFKGRTERVSVALLHAYENLHELSSSGHIARNLFVIKKTTLAKILNSLKIKRGKIILYSLSSANLYGLTIFTQ